MTVNTKAQVISFNTNDSISHIVLPNVFTPNEDSVNDVFRPLLDEITDLHCTIYNRWGTLIFESDMLRCFWDGRTTSGEPCCDGTYFCVVSATGVDGKKYKEKVALQLITNAFYK
jgi:gliding motility-associated-like protein